MLYVGLQVLKVMKWYIEHSIATKRYHPQYQSVKLYPNVGNPPSLELTSERIMTGPRVDDLAEKLWKRQARKGLFDKVLSNETNWCSNESYWYLLISWCISGCFVFSTYVLSLLHQCFKWITCNHRVQLCSMNISNMLESLEYYTFFSSMYDD